MLDQLGITVWRLRGQEAPVCVQAPCPRFVVVAEPEQADTELLNKILAALNASLEQVEILWVRGSETLTQYHWPKAPVIVFGENLHAMTPHEAIKTVSLKTLNQNLAAKKALWAQLKTLL